jgi:pimeloyl-ACP methyl ester carboxylesterase
MTSSTEYLTTADGTLAYDVTGPAGAPLVVCTPGMGDLRGSYRFLAPLLVAAGYRVATMDLRGLGQSDAEWPGYTPTDLGRDVLALVRHLGGPAVLVANSYTGDSAVWAATEAPELITAIALISPFLRVPPAGFTTKVLMTVAMPLIARFGGAWVAYYRSLYKGAKPADLDTFAAALKANLREPGRQAAFAATVRNTTADGAARMGELRCPVLVVMGSADPDFPDPAAEAGWLAGELRGHGVDVRTELLDGCGHYPQAEAPEPTAAAITGFLGAVRA